MCCLRKRKLFPAKAYFVLNLSAAGEFLCKMIGTEESGQEKLHKSPYTRASKCSK